MQRQWIIILGVMGILALVQLYPHLPRDYFIPRETEESDIPAAKTNQLVYTHSAPDSTSVPDLEYLSFTDRLLLMIDPEWLEKYQGSYTLEDLQSKDDVSSLKISSSWLLRNPALPQVGIILRQDAAEDTYRVSGGELFLPDSGVGVSYEKIEETGETKAFLNLKRDF